MTRVVNAWVLCVAVALAACTGGERQPAEQRSILTRVERTVYLMGTEARLVGYAGDRDSGLASLEALVRQLESVEAELSTWREDTPLSRFNSHPLGERWSVSEPLCSEMREVFEWQQATGGTFDPFVRALVDAWGIRGNGRVPTPEALEDARRKSGARLVEFNGSECWMRRTADVRIDEGAFGKGIALDRLKNVTLPHPLAAWLVNLGGHVAVGGEPPEPWTIGVAHPYYRDKPVFDVQMTSGSFDMSGESERDRMVGATRIRHILDPRTGRPASFSGSVAVWHERAFIADIAATALYVMGPDVGVPWAEARGLAAAFLVPLDADGLTVRATSTFQRRFLDQR